MERCKSCRYFDEDSGGGGGYCYALPPLPGSVRPRVERHEFCSLHQRDDDVCPPDSPNTVMDKPLLNSEVEWVVNELGELGVRIKGVCYFLYKGRSISSGTECRLVGKREFGEVCHPLCTLVGQQPQNPIYKGRHNEDPALWVPITHPPKEDEDEDE